LSATSAARGSSIIVPTLYSMRRPALANTSSATLSTCARVISNSRRVAISAFVLLALDLDATVIAEGLERPADLAALYDLGVDAAQGFLLGRPVPVGALRDGLRREAA